MVLETTWQTPSGWVIVRDALTVSRWHEGQRTSDYRRTPQDYETDHLLLRTIQCVNGRMEIELECEPAFDYGAREAQWRYDGAGYDRATVSDPASGVELLLSTDLQLGLEGRRAQARSTLQEGDVFFVALSWSQVESPWSSDWAMERIGETTRYWRDWLNGGTFPDHEWRIILQRSALTLKGLTYAPSGALLAAPTTSLPETPGGERNWDYRYTWIRDSSFALWALYTLGFRSEADRFFDFVVEACRDDQAPLQVMYGLDGETTLEEDTLNHLSGYEGARPVHIGNAAFIHDQHDVWGTFVDAVYLHTKSRDRLSDPVWHAVERQVEVAIEHWSHPDRGMWEVRGEPKHFTSSKVMCWVAVDRGARLAWLRQDQGRMRRWREVAREIKAEVCDRGVDDRGVFVQHYDTKALDAALLLIPLVRFLPREDPRVRATVHAIADELSIEDLVFRYRVNQTDDGFWTEEGTFTMCSFWLVSALAEIGEVKRARRLCEKLLSLANPLLLYAEQIEPATRRHLGNFPQAFTHLALINAVVHVIRGETELRPGSRQGWTALG
jgi:GH15 family glucan-1,4-alpha-glucosidase